MKISYIKSKGMRAINICYFISTRKILKNKMFDEADIAKAMDYAVSIDEDVYIETSPDKIKAWCENNNHSILKKKSWIFA